MFLWAPEEEGDWPPGTASCWWLHHSLKSLERGLRALGSRLILRQGPALPSLRDLITSTRATAVYWNRRYEPAAATRDALLLRSLREEGVRGNTYNASLLFEPSQIHNAAGMPFRVFTPFWKTCLKTAEPRAGTVEPPEIPSPAVWPASLTVEDLELLPRIDRTVGLCRTWQPGEEGTAAALQEFVDGAMTAYPEDRDFLGIRGVSRLSPHLHFGEIGPWQIWSAVQARSAESRSPAVAAAGASFLRQLGWREFAYHLLHHFPHTPDHPLRPEFASFPWQPDAEALTAWQQGRTGYPLVDAGMRELWATGWMHNRVRMVSASFLVKDLLISWQSGARWFWDTLVDADLANNTLGWQWMAGCGADAAPYFRIFNPVKQSERFDARGDYIRKWVPELRRLPTEWIHRPWDAPQSVLADAGIQRGAAYPLPIVDHRFARERALNAYAQLRIGSK